MSGDESKLPNKLKDKILLFRRLLADGSIQEIDLLYVHNLPESIEVEEELQTVAKHLANTLKEFDVQVRSHELGCSKLDQLYSSQNSYIDVLDSVEVPATIGIKQDGTKWKGAVATVSGSWVAKLYESFGDRLYSANYRGFLGLARRRGVNAGISDTIDNRPEDFWAYNNGITILTKKIDDSEIGKIKLDGISIINGAQTSGTIGEYDGDGSSGDISLLCRIVESSDEETIGRIVRYNNTQNAITSWDQYANDDQQKRLELEFSDLGFAYLKKRGFAAEGEQITIDAVFQPLLAFHGRSRDAVRGKSQLFENIALYENAYTNAKARHVLLVFALARAIDQVRLKLKTDQEAGSLIEFNEKQLRLLKNLNFKPFLLDVIAAALEIVRNKKTNRKTVAFHPSVAKDRGLKELTDLSRPIVEKVLPLVSIAVDPDTFFRRHSEDDSFIGGVIEQVRATVMATGIGDQLQDFSKLIADS